MNKLHLTGFPKLFIKSGLNVKMYFLLEKYRVQEKTMHSPCAILFISVHFRSVQFSRSVVSNSLRPHESQHTRPPCPSPTPRVYSNSCPSSRWCHPAVSSSVVPFSSCPQSLPASGSFPVSKLFAWGGQSIGVSASASVLPINTQDWSPLGWTGWISLQSKGLSRVFFNTHSSTFLEIYFWRKGDRIRVTLITNMIKEERWEGDRL